MSYREFVSGAGAVGIRLGPTQNEFDAGAGNRAAAETLRDNYATANPDWLADYDADVTLNILLLYTDGTDSVATYQTRSGGSWRDVSSVRGVRGLPGSGTDFGAVSENHIPAIGPAPDKLPFDSGLSVSNGVVETPDVIQTGPTGARLGPNFQLGAGMQALQLTYGDGTKALVVAREYDDTGSAASLFSYDLGGIQNFNINTANTTALDDPQEFTYTTTLNTLISNAIFIPNEPGTLRLQVFSGTDDTGTVLFDETREVLAGEVGNQTNFDAGNDYISPLGQTSFTRLSGISLRGGTGVSGDAMEGSVSPFLIGRVQPYTLDAVDPELVSGVGIRINSNADGSELTFNNTALEIVPIGAGARNVTPTDEGDLLFVDNTANTPLTLPSRVGVSDTFAFYVQVNNPNFSVTINGQSGENIQNLSVQPAVEVPSVTLSANVFYRVQVISGATAPGTVWRVLGVGGAAGDITAAQIKGLYESNVNTNAFEDAEKTKLGTLDGFPVVADVEWPITNVATYGDLAGTHTVIFNAYNHEEVDNVLVISAGVILPNANLSLGNGAGTVDVTISVSDAATIETDGQNPVRFTVQLRDDTNTVIVSSNFGQIVVGGVAAGTDAAAIHDNVAGEINAITTKATLASGDLFIIEDSEDGFNKKEVNHAAVVAGLGAGDSPALFQLANANLTITATHDERIFRKTVTAAVTLNANTGLADGFYFTVENLAVSGDATFDPGGSETVEGTATKIIPPGYVFRFIKDGTDWKAVELESRGIKFELANTATSIGVDDNETVFRKTVAGALTYTITDGLPDRTSFTVDNAAPSDAITLAPSGSETIEGSGSGETVPVGHIVQVIKDGTDWKTLTLQRPAGTGAGDISYTDGAGTNNEIVLKTGVATEAKGSGIIIEDGIIPGSALERPGQRLDFLVSSVTLDAATAINWRNRTTEVNNNATLTVGLDPVASLFAALDNSYIRIVNVSGNRIRVAPTVGQTIGGMSFLDLDNIGDMVTFTVPVQSTDTNFEVLTDFSRFVTQRVMLGFAIANANRTVGSDNNGWIFRKDSTATPTYTIDDNLTIGSFFFVQNINPMGNVTLATAGSETIEGSATMPVLAGFSALLVKENATNWRSLPLENTTHEARIAALEAAPPPAQPLVQDVMFQNLPINYSAYPSTDVTAYLHFHAVWSGTRDVTVTLSGIATNIGSVTGTTGGAALGDAPVIVPITITAANWTTLSINDPTGFNLNILADGVVEYTTRTSVG